MPSHTKGRLLLEVIAMATSATTIVGIFVASEFGPSLVGCPIKGNISKNTGERIYHVPGQEYYAVTRINWLEGERWFCSEADARASGWRRAGR